MSTVAVAWFGVGSNVGKVLLDNQDTAWTGSFNVDVVNFVEGVASLGEKVSATTVQNQTVNTTDVVGEPFDFSSGGGNDGDHLFGWLLIFAAWDTLAAGGFGLAMVDDLATDSSGTWYVGPQAGYLGGWASYAINPSADFDIVVAGSGSWTTTGNPAQLTGVDGFGARWVVTVSITGNTDNAFCDSFAVGQGYRLTLGDAGSTEGTFADFITFEEIASTGRFGGLRAISGILFAKSKLHIGVASGTTNTEFIDSNFTVVWEQQTLSDGASSAVASGFYALKFEQDTGTTDVTLDSGSLSAVDPHYVDLDFSGVNSVTITSLNVTRALAILLDSAVNWVGGGVTGSGLITLAGAIFSSITVSDSTVAADASAMLWNFNADPDGELNSLTIVKGIAAHHAIELGASTPIEITLRGWEVSGFNVADEQNDSVIHNTSGKTITVNVIGATGTISKKDTGVGSLTIIVADPVSVFVHAQTVAGIDVENVRVFLQALDGTGPFPFEDTVTIANSGTLATVTHTTHGMANNDKVVIRGASLTANNGVFTITVNTASEYEYTMGSTPGSSPTGTILSTFVALEGLTNVNGDVSTSRVYPSTQPITGHARKSTTAPFYKTAPLGGDISNTLGFLATAIMILDQ